MDVNCNFECRKIKNKIGIANIKEVFVRKEDSRIGNTFINGARRYGLVYEERNRAILLDLDSYEFKKVRNFSENYVLIDILISENQAIAFNCEMFFVTTKTTTNTIIKGTAVLDFVGEKKFKTEMENATIKQVEEKLKNIIKKYLYKECYEWEWSELPNQDWSE